MTNSILAALEEDLEPHAAHLILDLATAYLALTRSGDGPVSTSLPPRDIADRFDEPMPQAGRPLAQVVDRVERDVMSDLNRLMHPMYMGHQVAPPLGAAIWTEAVIAAMNQSTAVFEMSPSGTVLETRVIRWMCELAGFGAGSGGTFTSGGTEATFTALLAARARAMPGAWTDGMVSAGLPVVLCGEHAHYAVTRAVAQLGLGARRAIKIPSRDFLLDPEALAAKLDELEAQSIPVMAVVATAGSTATGSFDDLDAIGAICESRSGGIWLHVDGAHGASALFSGAHRYRLRGLGRARSLAWDPHKMMLMPLPAGMLLVRDERDLDSAFEQQAPYLFHGAGIDRVWDQGTRSFMCSRRVDALKVWVALQRYGASGIAELYDHLCAVTLELHRLISERSDFEALHEPESNILCFRYLGDGRLGDSDLDRLNQELREAYNLSGKGWITTTALSGKRVLRVTIMNPRTRVAHVASMLETLAAIAQSRH